MCDNYATINIGKELDRRVREEAERIRRKNHIKQIKENNKLNKILVDFQNEKLQFDFYKKFDLQSLIDMEECLEQLKYTEQNKKNIEIFIPVYVGIGAIVYSLISSIKEEYAPLLGYIVSITYIIILVVISLRVEIKRIRKISDYKTRLYAIRNIINEKLNTQGD